MKAAARWSEEEFGRVNLGDVRRTRRLVQMAVEMAARPSGTVSAVFGELKNREGAYDFLESRHVTAAALAAGMFSATATRAVGSPFVYVAIDGTSLSFTDRSGEKGFGPVNTRTHKSKGLMVNTALAVTPEGVPLGVIDQTFWSRPPTLKLTASKVSMRNKARAFEDKEPSEMLRSAKRAHALLKDVGVRACVVIDRAADNQDILEGLVDEEGCSFCVRAKYNRYLNDELRLRSVLSAEPILGTYEVEVGRTAKRSARTARMELRSKRVEVPIRRGTNNERMLALTAIWVREVGVDGDALDWLVYTNLEVVTFDDGMHVIEAYRTRWRIEEFHRTWKQGHCNVEDAQLQSVEALKKWATVLAAVATRIERLKYASRKQPKHPAISILSAVELEVLQLVHRKSLAKPPRPLAVDAITVADAIVWIALMGGWMGKSHGLPGSVTLLRGLEKLQNLVLGFEVAQSLKSGPKT